MNHEKEINIKRLRRRRHNRKKVRGDAERPRLSVFRSHTHIYCQIIDDDSGKTLVSASTRDKQLRGEVTYGGNVTAAQAVGKAIAQRAMEAGLKRVRFDRGHYKYHGRVAALADAAREGGLEL